MIELKVWDDNAAAASLFRLVGCVPTLQPHLAIITDLNAGGRKGETNSRDRFQADTRPTCFQTAKVLNVNTSLERHLLLAPE